MDLQGVGGIKQVLRHLLMIQFLGIDIKKVFEIEQVLGEKEYIYVANPRLDLETQRKRWLQVFKDNSNLKKNVNIRRVVRNYIVSFIRMIMGDLKRLPLRKIN